MHLLIAAAGSGKRIGAKGNKLLLPLGDHPILFWTLKAVLEAEEITWIGIVGQPYDKDSIMKLIKDLPKPLQWINGGSTRQESVQLGLEALPQEADFVMIHDGARCLVDPKLLNLCAQSVRKGNAVIAACKVTDTIKRADSEGFVIDTPPRSDLWAAQTPQAFAVNQLKKGHLTALENNWSVTDDASLYERLGWPVRILESSPSNIKVTTPFDLTIAESVIARKKII